jgi:hypothetical protein
MAAYSRQHFIDKGNLTPLRLSSFNPRTFETIGVDNRGPLRQIRRVKLGGEFEEVFDRLLHDKLPEGFVVTTIGGQNLPVRSTHWCDR